MSKSSSKKPLETEPRSKIRSDTDWERLDSMTDEAIDFSDDPEATPEMVARAVVRKGFKPVPGKPQVTLRIDADVLDWFKSRGSGYQTRINALLRAYMEASKPE